MKIGFITQTLPYLPCRDGFRIYAANIIRCLAARHEIRLISLLEPGDDAHQEWMRQFVVSMRLVPRMSGLLHKPLNAVATYALGTPWVYRAAIAEWLSREASDCDLLHVEGTYVAGLLPDHLAVPTVLSVHDCQSMRWASLAEAATSSSGRFLRLCRAKLAARYERLAYARGSACVVVAPSDAEALNRSTGRQDIAVISNGTDTEYFHPLSLEKKEGCVVFHGNLSYAPNVQAVIEFGKHIFPIVRRQYPDVHFRIVGATPAKEVRALAASTGFELLSDVADVRQGIGGAVVYGAPVRHGSGVKNKLLEAMAMEMPIVAYPEAAAGVGCRSELEVLLANTREEFAGRVVDLLQHPQRRAELGFAARKFVQEQCDWESRAFAFEELYGSAKTNLEATQMRPVAVDTKCALHED